MFRGSIRPDETRTLAVDGEGLADVTAQLTDQTPTGFELVSTTIAMRKGTFTLDAVGTFARRDGVREIEAEDMVALRAMIPDGWQLLSVHR